MTAPNVVSVATITGKTDVLAATTTATAITTAATGKLLKINSVIILTLMAQTMLILLLICLGLVQLTR